MRSLNVSGTLIILILSWLAPGVVHATLQFNATVDRIKASQSEAIRLTLTVTSTESLNHVPSPKLDLTAFDVFGPSVSTRTEVINGGVSVARELVYTLYGRKVGRFRIGHATIELGQGGESTLSTKPIDVEIVRRSRQGQVPAAADADRQTVEDVIFVRAVADRDTAYIGQQVAVRFDLCYRFNLRDVGFAEIPTFTGFWVKELFAAQRLSPKEEVIDGVTFNVAPLRRVGLFPTSAGTHTIDAMAVSCSIPQGRNRGSLFDALSLLDDPIFAREQKVLVRSGPIAIEVLPLPEASRPVAFAGAVGRFSIRAEVKPQQVNVGDPVTMRIDIEGDGNVQSIPEPEIRPRGFEVYPPSVELEERQTSSGAYGAHKKLEYILIPEQGGRLQIPAIAVSYFDPEVGRYQTASTAAFDILVDAGDSQHEEAPTYDLTRREIQQLGRDIRHIKPGEMASGSSQPLYRSGQYWVLHGLLPLAYVGLLASQRHRRRLEGDEAYARRRRARGEATKRLSVAAAYVEHSEGFHGALQEALVSYIADQLNRSAPGLTRQACRQLLTESGLDAQLVEGIDGLLERCEFGRFAPSQSGVAQRQALLSEGEDLVERLREALS